MINCIKNSLLLPIRRDVPPLYVRLFSAVPIVLKMSAVIIGINRDYSRIYSRIGGERKAVRRYLRQPFCLYKLKNRTDCGILGNTKCAEILT